ncbi:MAG: hypothetical protein HY791_02630 [Deltaproteobacteria bacterium]|nr:hypothetical protein [Deltaproteobacteria bacterium]
MQQTARVIKKYSNRRLYDTEESRYVTIEELVETIRSGRDVRVVDAQNGADLTQVTLTQAIIEGRGAGKLLPVPLLLRLIRLKDDALGEFLGRYMALALESYLQLQTRARSLASYNPFATVPFNAASAFARIFSEMAGWSDPRGAGWSEPPVGSGYPSPLEVEAEAQRPTPEADSTRSKSDEEVSVLRREIEELKGLVLETARSAAKPKRTAKKKAKRAPDKSAQG